jgi:hypothetical protein
MFYLEGILFCEGSSDSDYGAAAMRPAAAARHSPHRLVILVYRTVGDTELIFTKVEDFNDGTWVTPIPKKDAEELLRDYVKSAFVMLSATGGKTAGRRENPRC